MAYRFKTRSTTPTEIRLTDAAVSLLFAEQKTTDAAFLETNKDEITTAATDILAEFGVTGTAVGGGAALSRVRLGM